MFQMMTYIVQDLLPMITIFYIHYKNFALSQEAVTLQEKSSEGSGGCGGKDKNRKKPRKSKKKSNAG